MRQTGGTSGKNPITVTENLFCSEQLFQRLAEN